MRTIDQMLDDGVIEVDEEGTLTITAGDFSDDELTLILDTFIGGK